MKIRFIFTSIILIGLSIINYFGSIGCSGQLELGDNSLTDEIIIDEGVVPDPDTITMDDPAGKTEEPKDQCYFGCPPSDKKLGEQTIKYLPTCELIATISPTDIFSNTLSRSLLTKYIEDTIPNASKQEKNIIDFISLMKITDEITLCLNFMSGQNDIDIENFIIVAKSLENSSFRTSAQAFLNTPENADSTLFTGIVSLASGKAMSFQSAGSEPSENDPLIYINDVSKIIALGTKNLIVNLEQGYATGSIPENLIPAWNSTNTGTLKLATIMSSAQIPEDISESILKITKFLGLELRTDTFISSALGIDLKTNCIEIAGFHNSNELFRNITKFNLDYFNIETMGTSIWELIRGSTDDDTGQSEGDATEDVNSNFTKIPESNSPEKTLNQ